MSTFLSEEDQINLSELHHLLNSYYHITGYSIYAYNRAGDLIDQITKDHFQDVTQLINSTVKNRIKDFVTNLSVSALDPALYEVSEKVYTLLVPVVNDHQLSMFFLTEPFFLEVLSVNEKKDLYQKMSFSSNILVSYTTYSSFEYINRNRLHYLGQLFDHLSSNSIYIDPKDQHWKFSLGDPSLNSFMSKDKLINLPVVKEICDHLVIKDIQGALKTYQSIQSFFRLHINNKHPLNMLKYRLIALITLIQYHLSQHFKEINRELQQTANMCILQMDYHYSYSVLIKFGEKIIKNFYEVIEDQSQLNLSANILQAIEYIHENYMNKIRLTDIAKSIPMNETYLSTQFKQECNLPLNQYLNQYRIKQAIILIENSDYKLTQIALMVGFDSSNYFSTVFKKHTGLSPSQYSKSPTKN